ncbi:MAG: hypothetical protein BHW66_07835 [Akkermansia sp. 54_46]|nr:MAG: hypothetical protein BHW66_07835 [Akkermansia sp. 54_46]
MIGFQLIVLTGLLLTGGSVQRHATVDAQKRRPAFTDSEFGIRRGIKRTDAETYGKPFPARVGKGPTITK